MPKRFVLESHATAKDIEDDERESESPKTLKDNFLRNFFVFHCVLYVLGGTRVNIQNNTVSHTTFKQNLYAVVTIVAMTVSAAFYLRAYTDQFWDKDAIVLITCVFGCSMQYSSFLTNTMIGKYTQREKNIQIYYMLQKLDRILQLEHNRYYTSFLVALSVIITFLLLVFYTAGFLAHSFFLFTPLNTMYTIPFCFGMMTTYFDLILGISMIYFLIIRIRHLNQCIKTTTREDQQKIKEKSKGLFKNILLFVIPNPKLYNETLQKEKWLKCVQQIINSYRMITDLYSYSILLTATIILIWTFICIGVVVSGVKSKLYPFISAILLVTWATFYFVLLTCSAFFNDWFLKEMKNMKVLCVRVMSSDPTGEFYKTASQVFRAIHHAKLEFNVYGVFVFTSMIPLTLLGVVTSNMLVLVQFIIERK